MASLLYGLVIAVIWGCADMQCSLIPGNSRRVALLAHSVGLIALTGFGIATRGYPSFLTLFSCNERTLLLLSSFGLLSALAYFCLYRALQSAAPAGVISAILSANGAVSVLASVVFFHEYDGRVILILGILLAGVLLAAMSQTRISLHTPGIVCALVAMVALGGFNFGIGFVVSTGTIDWFPLLFGTRAFSLLFLVLAFAFSPRPTTQRGGRLDGRSCLLAGGTGLTEMIGLLLFSLAAHLHLDLALTSAIASCSSIVPLIASFVRRESVHIYALEGIVLILFGLLCLSWTVISPLLMCLIVAGILCLFPHHKKRQGIGTVALARWRAKEPAMPHFVATSLWHTKKEAFPVGQLYCQNGVFSPVFRSMLCTTRGVLIACGKQTPRFPP